jgi:hypothetical protein
MKHTVPEMRGGNLATSAQPLKTELIPERSDVVFPFQKAESPQSANVNLPLKENPERMKVSLSLPNRT